MRSQTPGPLERATPLPTLGVLPVVNDQLYLAHLAAQREVSAPALLEGGKPRAVGPRVVAGVLAAVAASIRGLQRALHVRSRPDWGILWKLVPYIDTICVVDCFIPVEEPLPLLS